jgi:hypothetical protein
MASNFLIANNFLFEPVGTVTPIIVAPVYEARAVFSISASNEFQGTFWVVKNGQQLLSNLGEASYLVRDQNGNTVGIVESSIVADSNGLYQITPVQANAILDLTHYTVEVSIVADSGLRKNVIGITLGE